MNTNHETKAEPNHDDRAHGEPPGALELLAASGVGAEMVYEGAADACPHCASRVLSEAA